MKQMKEKNTKTIRDLQTDCIFWFRHLRTATWRFSLQLPNNTDLAGIPLNAICITSTHCIICCAGFFAWHVRQTVSTSSM